jgi:site-specific recombinase XerD
MRAMLTLQRRHSEKCPDKKKGPNYLKCRGHCAIRICGMQNGKRVRTSLKTRDIRRAARRLAEMDEEAVGRPRKTLGDAINAFHAQHAEHAQETKRKYKRVLAYLAEYCGSQQLRYVDQIIVEGMDGYALWRSKTNWTWIKEIEILRQFFAFCIDREWTHKNPAKALKRPRLQEANDVQPYTQEEIVRMIAACDFIGRGSYERLRARAMVLLMRFVGLRISDVVTLSRDHIKGTRIEKRAEKNGRWIRVKLPSEVLRALDALPHPKAAPRDSHDFFGGGQASQRSLVKGAWRTLAAVFKRAKVEKAHPHRFRHTLASEILGKGGTIEDVAGILADSPATIRRHYAKWTPEYQARQDRVIGLVHGTDLAQAEEQVSKC